jgi:hypothetical protein
MPLAPPASARTSHSLKMFPPKKYLVVWIAFIVALPFLFALNQFEHNIAGTCVDCNIAVVTLLFLFSFACAIICFGLSRNRPSPLGLRLGLIILELLFGGLYLLYTSGLQYPTISQKVIQPIFGALSLVGLGNTYFVDIDAFKAEYEAELRQIEATTLSYFQSIEHYHNRGLHHEIPERFTAKQIMQGWPGRAQWESLVRSQYEGTRVKSIIYHDPIALLGFGILAPYNIGIAFSRIGNPLSSPTEKLTQWKDDNGMIVFHYEWTVIVHGKSVLVAVELEK